MRASASGARRWWERGRRKFEGGGGQRKAGSARRLNASLRKEAVEHLRQQRLRRVDDAGAHGGGSGGGGGQHVERGADQLPVLPRDHTGDEEGHKDVVQRLRNREGGQGRVRLDKRLRLEHGTLVRELLEAKLAVALAHATRPDTAKRKVDVGNVVHGRVDAGASGVRRVQDLLLHLLVLGEDVQRQRLLAHLADDLDRVLRVVDRDDRQHGSEDLLPQQRLVQRRALHQRRREEPVARVRLRRAAQQHLALRLLHEPGDASQVTLVDDPAPVGGALRVLAEAAGNVLLHLVDKLLVARLVHQHIVGCDARLADVVPLRVRDPVDHTLHLRRLVDNHGRLASKLKRDRRQVLGSRLHHHLAHSRASREEDVVPLKLQQRSRLLNTTLHHLDARRVEVLVHHVPDETGAVARHLRRLDHHAVAGRDGRDERREHQLDGVVPRRDDEHDALRVVADVGAAEPGGGELQRGGHSLVGRPAVEVGEGMLGRRVGQHLTDAADLAATQVLADGRGEQLRVLLDHDRNLLKLLPAPLQVLRLPRVKLRPQLLQHRLELGHRVRGGGEGLRDLSMKYRYCSFY
eukprot:Rhum_TRINITY_DN14716_c0_g1::Rhum_TRINITY_DN14716_c0_g1_i1::g.110958::m.110958